MTSFKRDLQVVYRPPAELIPYPLNPRKNDGAVDRMCETIQELRFTIPILATSSGDIIDGHLRLKAAERLGLESIPVILCDDWSPEQIRAFRLLVNRSATWAEWDMERLAAELAALQASDFDLKRTGFDSDELDEVLAPLCGHTDEDAIVEPATVPITRLGDLWLLDRHRLRCGDATNAADVAELVGEYPPNLMVADPPYGVDYQT